jgi:hypothetical protein
MKSGAIAEVSAGRKQRVRTVITFLGKALEVDWEFLTT